MAERVNKGINRFSIEIERVKDLLSMEKPRKRKPKFSYFRICKNTKNFP